MDHDDQNFALFITLIAIFGGGVWYLFTRVTSSEQTNSSSSTSSSPRPHFGSPRTTSGNTSSPTQRTHQTNSQNNEEVTGEDEGDKIEVSIKMKNKTLTLKVGDRISIHRLKRKVVNEFQNQFADVILDSDENATHFRLIFRGRIADDSWILKDHGITNEVTLLGVFTPPTSSSFQSEENRANSQSHSQNRAQSNPNAYSYDAHRDSRESRRGAGIEDYYGQSNQLLYGMTGFALGSFWVLFFLYGRRLFDYFALLILVGLSAFYGFMLTTRMLHNNLRNARST